MSPQPSLFVSHGAPTLMIDPSPARDFLAGLGASLEPPKAILVISAHFNAPRPTLTATAQPETIHDFGGFPDELYKMQYPAPGAPDLAARIALALNAAGFDAATHPARGLDQPLVVLPRVASPQRILLRRASHRGDGTPPAAAES